MWRRVAVGVLLVLAAGTAAAADFTIPLKLYLNKAGRKAKFVSRGPFTLPDPNSLVSLPGSVSYTDSTSSEVIALTGAKGLGTPAGSKGVKFKDPSGATCKVLLVNSTVIKGTCRSSVVGEAPDPNGVIGIVVGVGGYRYCGECGGAVVGTGTKTTRRKNCEAPGACPSVAACSGAAVGGSCWFLGGSDESCDTVCGNQARVYDSATSTYAGSGGTGAHCIAVLDALGVPAGSLGFTSGLCGSALECCFVTVHVSDTGRSRCTDAPPDSSGHSANFQRVCACQ